MNFFQAIVSCLNKYADFSGRASRSEYWYFFLFRVICGYAAGTIDRTVFQGYIHTLNVGPFIEQIGIFGIITGIFFFLPGLAVGVRRSHDINRSGWWLLLAFTLVGILFPLIYWLSLKGTNGDNRYGPDPLAAKP